MEILRRKLVVAWRILFQAEDQLAQIRLSRLEASVGLFKVLGGAWKTPAFSQPPEERKLMIQHQSRVARRFGLSASLLTSSFGWRQLEHA